MNPKDLAKIIQRAKRAVEAAKLKEESLKNIAFQEVLRVLLQKGKAVEIFPSTSTEEPQAEFGKYSLKHIKRWFNLPTNNEKTLLIGCVLTEKGKEKFGSAELKKGWHEMQAGGQFNTIFARRCESKGWFYPGEEKNAWEVTDEGREHLNSLRKKKAEESEKKT